MTGSERVDDIANRLHLDGQEVFSTRLPGGPVVVGYRADFRLRWIATKLHLFTFALAVPAVTGGDLDRYAGDALEFAVQRRGGARGLQSGVAVIPIVVANQVDQSAVDLARERIVKRWAAFAWPVVLDGTSGAAYRHEGSVWFGGVYARWMRHQTGVALGG